MKRFWTRSILAMLCAAAPFTAIAQEPAVDVLKPVDVLVQSTTPIADPAAELQSIASDVYALASDDIVTFKASLEPVSPSDSQSDSTQPTAAWVAQAAPARDAFEERVARLEAQVAALAAQLKSNSVAPAGATAAAPATTTVMGTFVAPRAAVARTAPAAAIYRAQVPAVTAPIATTPAARYSYSLTRPAQAGTTATTSAAPGAPIVIHIYVHGATGAPAAAAPAAPSAFFYSVPLTTAPAGATGVTSPSAPMTTAPVRVRARAVPAMPAVPPVSANPTPGVLFVPATPATPAVPATPSVPAVPALPGIPGVPAGVPSAVPGPPAAAPAGALTPTSTSRIAWDDVPTSEK